MDGGMPLLLVQAGINDSALTPNYLGADAQIFGARARFGLAAS